MPASSGSSTPAHEYDRTEAAEQGIAFADHFLHLVVHGFLHILGYDHLAEDEALAMEGLETQILQTLGVADPYAGEHDRTAGAVDEDKAATGGGQ